MAKLWIIVLWIEYFPLSLLSISVERMAVFLVCWGIFHFIAFYLFILSLALIHFYLSFSCSLFFSPFLSLSPFLSVSPFISSYLSFLYLYRFPSNGALSLPHWHTSHLSCSSSSTFFFPSPSWKSNHFYSFRLPLPISNPQPHFEPFEKALRFGSKPVSSIHFYSYYLYAFFFCRSSTRLLNNFPLLYYIMDVC